MVAQHVLHRSSKARPPLAVRGEGIYIFDESGKRYIDACGGAAVSCLGHGNRAVADAVSAEVARLDYVHTGFFTSAAAEELADVVVAQSPGHDRVWFTSSGSEAIEAALKLARQFHLERGDSQRQHVIARRMSYHGNTLGALAVGGHQGRRAPFAPLLMDVAFADPCFEYRFAEPGENAEDYGERAARSLESEIERLGPETVMAFVAETVVGATAGAVPPAPGYLRHVRDICDRYGILLVLDEVMCGSGRTGTFLAAEEDGVRADITTIGKGLGAGYQPIGATLCTAVVHDAVAGGSGAFKHGQTYNAHPAGCAAALAVQQVVREEDLLDRCKVAGRRLTALLSERLGQHSHVGDIRGRGLFQAVELVADRESKKPFDPALALHLRAKADAFERGLLIYPGGGTADGVSGDHILLAPPYNVSEMELEAIVDLLVQTIDAVVPA